METEIKDNKAFSVDSSSMYDLLAPGFREISETRKDWIKSINEYVTDCLSSSDQLLDIGAGDGIRAREIADTAGTGEIVLVEPSIEMCKLARKVPNSKLITTKAENLSKVEGLGQFDAILCLWNVLGHIPTFENRVVAVRNMIELLKENGAVYLDVNNRYNVQAYGDKAILNIANDIKNPQGLTGENGDVNYEISYGNIKIPASGHVFSEKELELVARSAGAKIDTVKYFHYDTGKLVDSQFEGQIFMILRKQVGLHT